MKTKMKQMILASAMTLALGCSNNNSTDTSAKYNVGVIQLVQHPALDVATQGFTDALKAELGDDVNITVQVAAGDSSTCITIANSYVSEGVDLIMANATPALQAASSATSQIPILGTSVTEYGTALSLKDFNGTVGGNISGTADLPPLVQQAELFKELLPNAKNIGILYCSSEPNSVYQSNIVQKELEKLGYNVKVYTFSDSNDVSAVTQTVCQEVDAIYIPTDNTAASCAEAINNVAEQAGVPIIAGEENMCNLCGIATLSIDYYELGQLTGKMAAEVLTGKKNISDMPIQYYENPVKKFDKERAEKLGISIPSDYTEIQ